MILRQSFSDRIEAFSDSITLSVAALVLIIATHRVWLRLLGGFLVIADPLQPADVVVPLAGEPVRIQFAAELLREGYGHALALTNMWIDGDSAPLTYANWAADRAHEGGVADTDIVIIPQVVRTTYEEAHVIRRFAEEQQWQSILIVTSPSHTRRSRMIFRDVFRQSPIAIIVQPVDRSDVLDELWWRTEQGRREIGLEYLKLVLYHVGYR